MKRKVKILIGGIIILTALFINFILSSKSQTTEITFDNIEAIAQQESGKPKPTCIYTGLLCSGVDKNGTIGTFYGLSFENPD